jgi:hypothetical protein
MPTILERWRPGGGSAGVNPAGADVSERAVTAHPRANGRSAGIVAAPGLDST